MQRVLVLLAAALALAVLPIAADATAKKKTAEELESEKIAKEHDNTRRALRDGLPLVLPSWSLPVFFGMHMDEKLSGKSEQQPDKKTKKAKTN
jgi:hypothetical protein